MITPAARIYASIRHAAALVVCALVLYATGCMQPTTDRSADAVPTELVLLTTNDLHGRLEPFTVQDGRHTRIAGGFAGLAAAMQSATRERPEAVLRLNSGDTLTGPYWVYLGGEALFGALSSMGIDAATLGNHEFDRGPHALAQALKHCTFSTIVTNLDIPDGHVLADAVKPFYLFERAGARLLVIGLLTPDLPWISSPGPDIHVRDPFSADMRERILTVIQTTTPDLVIALTHLGLDQDRRLARHIPEIDVICGGHSHDLLPAGKPVTVSHSGGRRTVLVQAGSGGIALGVLHVRLAPGTPPVYDWQPLNITASSGLCPHMQTHIDTWRAQLPQPRVLTATETPIDCRSETLGSREAPIGNFIADSLREYFQADVALYNGGGIRGDYLLPAGEITSRDLAALLPFDNDAVVVRMSGAQLRQVLEYSVARLPRHWGGFLQVSGLRMVIDPLARAPALQRRPNDRQDTTAPGERIVRVDVMGPDGEHALDHKRIYRVVTNAFLARGGNGYYQFAHAGTEPPTGMRVRDVVAQKLQAQPRHRFKADDRITVTASPQQR